jgi:hypothetical protein
MTQEETMNIAEKILGWPVYVVEAAESWGPGEWLLVFVGLVVCFGLVWQWLSNPEMRS